MMQTSQTRPRLNAQKAHILSECSFLFNHVERSLYAKVAAGQTTGSCKSEFLKRYGITARQFNACRVSLEGKISACRVSKGQAIENLKQQIELINQQIQCLEKKPSKRFILHQKKRRKGHLSKRLLRAQNDYEEKRVHLCFGGKKLFRSQFYLEQNGFTSHQEWKAAWEAKRTNEFFVLGSKDERAGNQTCTATVQQDGKLHLRIRLPDVLREKYGKYLEIEDVWFAYGHDALLASLNNPEGQAISYRFKQDEKGWRIFASTNLKKPGLVCAEGIGVIGIDLNTDHIACLETDRSGNPLTKQVIPWISHGKTKEELKAIVGDICKQIVEKAKDKKKPIIIEQLDFKNKKSTLKELGDPRLSRLLSSFAYGLFFSFLSARAFKHGVAVHQVNPAFTSIMGRVNYATRYGLSTHLAAALCIARRYQKFSEAPCLPSGKIPDGKGGHVAFVLPERNRTKHVWHFWKQVKRKLSTVLAAHRRAILYRSLSPPKPTLEISNSRLLLV